LVLGDVGQADVNHHLMSVYAEPLRAYLACTPYRSLGEPDDLVEGFFADRLGRPEFLSGWRRSEKRLRHWLMNAFVFYLKETVRGVNRQRRSYEISEEFPDDSQAPGEVLDRAFAMALVQTAMEQARESCRSRGLGDHFDVFREHYWNDVAYAELGTSMGVSPERARVMARTARDAFRRALRALLLRDGGQIGNVDGEIDSLLEVLQ
jgi:DNA-directed RNA polymerase specialized sigma24 family protein